MRKREKSKPRKLNEKKLLELLVRETVKEVLSEQVDYSNDLMYKAFVQPFTDIFKTAQHGLESISATAIGETKTLAKALAFTAIPFIKPEAGSIMKMGSQDRNATKEKLSQIDSNFGDVLDRNWQMLNNPDVWGTLFFLHPQLAIGSKIATHAPEVALELLSTLTGGSQAVESVLSSYKKMKVGGRDMNKGSYSPDYSHYGGQDMWGGDGGDGGAFQEQVQPQQPPAQQPPAQQPQQTPPPPAQQAQQPTQPQRPQVDPDRWAKAQIQKLLGSPEIERQIASSPITRKMQQMAINVIVQAAVKDLGAITFQKIQSAAGGKLKAAVEELKKKLPPEQQNQDLISSPELQKMIVANVKQALKPAYVKQLQTLIQTNRGAAPLVNKAIQQVQKL